MVNLMDFIDIMKGSEVIACRSCGDDRIQFETNNLDIHINGRTYQSVKEVYKDVKNPKVVTWTYTEPYLDEGYFEIWCKE